MSSENLNTGAFSHATDLKNRILFTIFLLIVYRLGTYVPLSGIDPDSLKEVMASYGIQDEVINPIIRTITEQDDDEDEEVTFKHDGKTRTITMKTARQYASDIKQGDDSEEKQAAVKAAKLDTKDTKKDKEDDSGKLSGDDYSTEKYLKPNKNPLYKMSKQLEQRLGEESKELIAKDSNEMFNNSGTTRPYFNAGVGDTTNIATVNNHDYKLVRAGIYLIIFTANFYESGTSSERLLGCQIRHNASSPTSSEGTDVLGAGRANVSSSENNSDYSSATAHVVYNFSANHLINFRIFRADSGYLDSAFASIVLVRPL